MAKAENRHYDKVHKQKQHPAAKCKRARCSVCHPYKITGTPTRQQLRENNKLKGK